MNYIATIILTFVATLVFVHWDDIQTSRINKKNRLQLKKLFNGTPLHVITIYNPLDLLDFRHYPILINGDIYKPNLFWHCNDEYFAVKNKFDKTFYISEGVKSRKFVDGKWVYDRYLKLGEFPETGYEIKPCAVVEVY